MEEEEKEEEGGGRREEDEEGPERGGGGGGRREEEPSEVDVIVNRKTYWVKNGGALGNLGEIPRNYAWKANGGARAAFERLKFDWDFTREWHAS